MLKIPTIELIKTSPIDLNLVKIDRESLWAEFGQLKIADSTRKQYVKAIVEDDAQASRISVSSLIVALRLQRRSRNFSHSIDMLQLR